MHAINIHEQILLINICHCSPVGFFFSTKNIKCLLPHRKSLSLTIHTPLPPQKKIYKKYAYYMLIILDVE